MTRYFIIILTVVHLFSCSSPNGQINISDSQVTAAILNKTNTSWYKPDTNYTTKGESPFALEDIKLGKRLLLDKISQDEIIKHRIKSIQQVSLYIEKFNEKGFKIFEKWDAWYAGSRFEYELDKSGKPLTISILDTNDNIIGTARYKYDLQGKLLQAGNYILKYYPTGKLKCVEDPVEIETYEYDENGNLNRIKFDWNSEVLGCGNRTTEWKGEYNDKKQLIKSQTFGFPVGTTKHFEYATNGQIAKIKNIPSMGNEITTTEFIYADGLLIQTKTFDHKDKLKYVTNWSYEKH